MKLLKEGFHGAGLQHISKKYILDIQIPNIPIDKQLKINDIGDKLNRLIYLRKKQLEKYDGIVKSRFIEMFGDPINNQKKWDTMSLKQAGKRLSDGPFGSNLKLEHYTDNGIRVIRLGNIGVGRFIDNDKAFVSYDHYENIKKYTCRAGEIVLGTLGEPNLRACIIPKYIDYAINKADCVHYIPKRELLDTHFVCQYINLPETLLVASRMIHGQTRSRISSGQIAELSIFIPPLELQKKFAVFYQQVDKSKFECSVTINLLKSHTFYKYFQP